MSATGIACEPPRYEIKYHLRADAYDTMCFLVGGQGLLRTFPPRIVQSIYLDTADCRAAAENISGQSHRRKLRYRWYGEDVGAARGALELKRRENVLVIKERAAVVAPVAIQGQTRPTLARTLRLLSPPTFRALLDEGLEPTQWIRYERDYFATRDGRIRVTVDRRLKAWDLRDAYVVTNRIPTPLPDSVVVECKALVEHHDDLQDFAGTLPFTRTRCSKYVMACLPGHYRV